MTPTRSETAAIVTELLELDPSLASRRAELDRLVEELLRSRPEAKIRPAFAQELKRTLRAQMKSDESAPFSFLSFFLPMDTRYLFAGAGALVGGLAVFVVTQQSGLPALPAVNEGGETVQPGITAVAPRAFGQLANQAAGGLGGGGGDAAISYRPQSGGGGGNPVPALSASEVVALEESVAKDAMMIAPMEPYRVSRFLYEGALTLPTTDQSVYRRVKPDAKPSGQSAIADFARDLLDWSSLGTTRMQNVSLVSGDFNVYIDYTEGSLSVNRIYDASDRPEWRCQTEDCYQQYRLKESDMIADSEAISIARAFAEQLGIDLSKYGEPQVTDNWQIMYARSSDKAAYWFPEQMSVVFPLLLDGQPVYEEYGNAYGLSVSVDVRKKEGAGLYNHYVQSFEKSDYAPVADEQKVRDAIKNGTLYMWDDPNAQYVDVKLGEATTALMHSWQWIQESGESRELFVPALVFPVLGEPANEYENRQRVVVPLVQELYDAVQNQPQPMPLMEGDPMPVDLGDPTGGPTEDTPAEEETPPTENPEPRPMQ